MFGKIYSLFLAEGGGTPPPAGGGGTTMLIMFALFGLMFYFLILRPQKKQQKQIEDMRNSLKVGDEISTTGGILGKIIQIKDDFLVIENGADRTKIKIAKWAVRSIDVPVETDDDDDEEEDDDE